MILPASFLQFAIRAVHLGCHVESPDRKVKPGERLDLTTLPGWKTPGNGNLGDPFHRRVDSDQWRRGCLLRATARLVGRNEETNKTLQKLADFIRSREVLAVEFQGRQIALRSSSRSRRRRPGLRGTHKGVGEPRFSDHRSKLLLFFRR